MRCYLLFSNNEITFLFPTKILWWFTWENSIDLELFGLFIYNWVKRPFSTARAISKYDRIARTFIKESSKILRYSNEVQLIWMEEQIKNMSCSMNGISCQEYSVKYIYSTSQISKLSLKLHTFSITDLVAGLFLISVIIVILSTLEICMAWFIPHLIKNSFALVKVTLNV